MMPDRARLCQALRGELSAEAMRPLLPEAVREGVHLWLAARIAERDEESRRHWQRQRRIVELEAMRKRHALAQVARALNKKKIRFVLLRGWGVAVRHWGADAPLRPISDHDLLIAPEQFLLAKQALSEIGFRPDPIYKDIFVRGDVQLDLHWEPLGAARIRSWAKMSDLSFAHLIDKAECIFVEEEPVLVPEPAVELVFLCFHALKHSFERLVWLWDIALAARHIEKHSLWDAVQAKAEAHRLTRPLFYALSYAKAHLDAPAPAALLDAIRPAMGRGERRLFSRVMAHEVPPFLAERVFSRMQPSLGARIEFWRETIWPSYEVRAQIAGSGCVKCNFIRKRLKQALRWAWDMLPLGRVQPFGGR